MGEECDKWKVRRPFILGLKMGLHHDERVRRGKAWKQKGRRVGLSRRTHR